MRLKHVPEAYWTTTKLHLKAGKSEKGKKRRGERSEPYVRHPGKIDCKDGDVKLASSLRACPMVAVALR